jgi:hypothetical protein
VGSRPTTVDAVFRPPCRTPLTHASSRPWTKQTRHIQVGQAKGGTTEGIIRPLMFRVLPFQTNIPWSLHLHLHALVAVGVPHKYAAAGMQRAAPDVSLAGPLGTGDE